MKGYLANGLFSEADVLYNQLIASRLRGAFPDLELYVPQENMAINNKEAYADSLTIANGDDEKLLQADILIAVLDGVEIDAGVACEIGKFSGYNKATQSPRPIIGLYTDIRQQGTSNQEKIHALQNEAVENQFPYRNLYVIGTIKDTGGKVVTRIEDMIESIQSLYN